MIKPRKNISLDIKTHAALRKLAFKRSITVSQLLRDLYMLALEGGVIKKNLTIEK